MTAAELLSQTVVSFPDPHTQQRMDYITATCNQLEWQAKFQGRVQKSGEQLAEYVGYLRMMADRAYPKWSTDQRLELVRDQFIQGVQCSSTQLRLMKEMPKTVEEAVTLATQLEAIEAALCRQRTRESLAVERDTKPWDGEDSEESLAAAVKRTDNVPWRS